MNLIEQLEQKLAETERIALAANHQGRWDTSGDDGPAEGVLYALAGNNPKDGWKIAEFTLYTDGVANAANKPNHLPAYSTMPIHHIENAIHAAHNDPKRVLGKVAADREILAEHAPTSWGGPPLCITCSVLDGAFSNVGALWPCKTVLALAKGHGIDTSGTAQIAATMEQEGLPY